MLFYPFGEVPISVNLYWCMSLNIGLMSSVTIYEWMFLELLERNAFGRNNFQCIQYNNFAANYVLVFKKSKSFGKRWTNEIFFWIYEKILGGLCLRRVILEIQNRSCGTTVMNFCRSNHWLQMPLAVLKYWKQNFNEYIQNKDFYFCFLLCLHIFPND